MLRKILENLMLKFDRMNKIVFLLNFLFTNKSLLLYYFKVMICMDFSAIRIMYTKENMD